MNSATLTSLSLIIGTTLSQFLGITLNANSLVTVNDWQKTSNYLLGLSAYSGLDVLYNNEANMKLYNEQYGINSIGYGGGMSEILPESETEAVSCCNTAAGVKSYVESGTAACDRFQTIWNEKIYGSEYYVESTTFETFLYLYDHCRTYNKPTINHCQGSASSQQGTPLNDGWWQQLMIGFIGCALEVDPDIQHAHIWNEPGTVHWTADAEYYSQFYFDTVKAIKEVYPQMKMAGPTLWGPPVTGLVWEDYFAGLMDKVVTTEGRPDLLDYIDFHAYIHSNDGYHARWDRIVNSVHAISHYYNVISDGDNIRSVITETNVDLDGVASSYGDGTDAEYWNDRVMTNAQQIMALSFQPDKFKIRQQFDMGASGYSFNGNQDYKMYDLMKPINDGFQVSFSFDTIASGYPHFDNGNCIMTQNIFNDIDYTLTVLLINYCDSDKQVTIKDADKKVTFSNTARFANQWWVNNAYSVGVGSYQVWVTAKKQSVTAITGQYAVSPSKEIKEIEFISSDKSMVMRPSNPQTKDELSVTYTVNIKNIPGTGYTYSYSKLKFGFFDSLMTDFKYTITVKSGNGLWTYLTVTDYIPSENDMLLESFEFPIESSSISGQMWNGNTLQITFSGTRIQTGKKWWLPWAGRIVFASIVAGFESDEGALSLGDYIRVTTKGGSSKYWYSVVLSNIPSGHEIQYVKMKDANMLSWEKGLTKWDYYYFASNTPYTAPFSFKIRSATTGQEITSYNVITDINEYSYGDMTEKLASAGSSYTEDTNDNSGLSTAAYILIVMGVLIVVGICIFVGFRYKKRNTKKMNDDISMVNKTQETDDNNDTQQDTYDMSPIDIDNTEQTQQEQDQEQEL